MNPKINFWSYVLKLSNRWSANHIYLSAATFMACFFFCGTAVHSQGTRLLRQPSITETQVAFAYGGDIWITDFDGRQTVRLTSTPAVESNPHFSPDGKWIAFNSNRSGTSAVYVVSAEGGTPKRLTWHPAPASVCG